MSQSIYKREVRSAFNNFVMVNETLVKHFKDANPALFLGYLISEDKYLEKNNKLDKWGYFYCTSAKIEEKFGLTHKVQDRIIGLLVEHEFIKVVVKRVEGSSSISQRKHFKVLHENIYNVVRGIKIEKVIEMDDLPTHLLNIQNALMTFAKTRNATYVKTAVDEKILKIASTHGLCPEIINQSIGERHKRLQGKQVTAKYLLSAFIQNINEFESMPPQYQESASVLKVS